MNASVALINASGRFDGITAGLRQLLVVLPGIGHPTTWYQCVDYGVPPYEPPGVRLVRGAPVPLSALSMGLNRLVIFPLKLRGISEYVILLADPTLLGIARTGKRTVVKVHDLRALTPYADKATTRIMFDYVLPRLRLVDRVIVTTQVTARLLAERGLKPDRVRIVPETHGDDLHPEHRVSSLVRIRETQSLRVLCISTDRHYKNLGLLAQVAARLQEMRAASITFTLVSHLRNATRQAINQLRLPNLTVCRSVPSLDPLFESHDVLFFPSRYEGFGMPLLEAMSFGMPIVASRTPVSEEVVSGGGQLLSPDDESQWVESLLGLLDPASYSNWSNRSWSRADQYSVARFTDAARNSLKDL